MMKRRVVITVDVEAQPARAPRNHIDQLIYGRLGDGEEFGIGRMFDIAEKHGVGITCFLDYAEEHLYGDALLDVGRYIAARGHDLQVHLHPEFMSSDSFVRSGVKRINDMFEVGTPQARLLIEYAVDAHHRVTSNKPVAFRGGGYRYNGALLAELARYGFKFNSSYNPSRENQPFNIGPLKQFKWTDGIIELPISCVPNHRGTKRIYDYNFNNDLLLKGTVEESIEAHARFLEEFFKFHGDDAIAVMVMHSWSLLNFNQISGFYDSPNPEAAEKFDALLSMMTDRYELLTAEDLSKSDLARCDRVVRYRRNKFVLRDSSNDDDTSVVCDVCGASEEHLIDYNGPRRKCGVCGSVERQRALGAFLRSDLWPVDLNGKRILLVSPSDSEKRLITGIANAQVSTLDIRKELKPDIVADICAMPHVPSRSFDVIFASHVLVHVHDLKSALSELARILVDDGIFISHEPSDKDSMTQELSDIEQITQHYGKELHEKYKIGRFRKFGDLDLDRIFELQFERTSYDVIDRLTNTHVTWNIWDKINLRSQLAAVHIDISLTDVKEYAGIDYPAQHLFDDEWVFFKNHIVSAGIEVEVYGRIVTSKPRSLAVFDVAGNVVARLNINGCLQGLLLERFDASCSTEDGAPAPLGKILIPYSLTTGAYLIDGKWLFFVQGSLTKADVAIVLPMSTMHFFNKALGGSAYDESRKQLRYLRCSMNRPLARSVLSSAVCISFELLRWLAITLKTEKVCYLADFEVPTLVRQSCPRLVIIPGRSEDWNHESRLAIRMLIDSGCNVLCMSGETMYWDILVDRSMGIVQRDRQRWRFVDKENCNPLRNIIGCNPYDGGFLIDMAGENDPGYGRFKVVEAEERLFQGTGLAPDSIINLPSVAYDGLPISSYSEQGNPSIDLSGFTGWEAVRVFAYCCGVNTPERKIGAFALFDAGFGKGQVVHMGSMAWSMRHAFEPKQNAAQIILRNVVNHLLRANGTATIHLEARKSAAQIDLKVDACPICGDALQDVNSGQNCKGCESRARLRSMAPLMREYLVPRMRDNRAVELPLLAFAMTGAERKFLSTVFKSIKSVSLYGSYSSDHESGVDMRDLSRYPPNGFSGVFGCLLFDYFPEHEQALRECYRVIAPGGVFFTHIAPYRLVDGDMSPQQKGAIKSRAGYFEYLPDKTELPDVKVGRDWFLSAMERVGFKTALVRVRDAVPGLVSEWFIGIKPGAEATPKEKGFPVSNSSVSAPSNIETRISEVFRSIVPWGPSAQAVLRFELIEAQRGSLVFLEDCYLPALDGGGSIREVVATNGSRNQILVSRDLGKNWQPLYENVKWDDKIRWAFSLADGSRLIRTFSGRMYHLGAGGELVSEYSTGAWHWHGSQGIGQSNRGTVMYAEYAPLRDADGVQDLSVWRYRPWAPQDGWHRVLTLPAAVRPPQGELRHFHVCRPHPSAPSLWILASGDIGAHCRMWLSQDDGDHWQEVMLDQAELVGMPEGKYPRLLRFTQCAALDNGDLIWGTDDISDVNRAALISLSLSTNRPVFRFLGWLGRNCIRNIASLGGDRYLLLSESIHDPVSADCILYNATAERVTPFLLPNLGQIQNTVTDSLGSLQMPNGVGFFPAQGAVLMHPDKRGIFRVSIEDLSQ